MVHQGAFEIEGVVQGRTDVSLFSSSELAVLRPQLAAATQELRSGSQSIIQFYKMLGVNATDGSVSATVEDYNRLEAVLNSLSGRQVNLDLLLGEPL